MGSEDDVTIRTVEGCLCNVQSHRIISVVARYPIEYYFALVGLSVVHSSVFLRLLLVDVVVDDGPHVLVQVLKSPGPIFLSDAIRGPDITISPCDSDGSIDGPTT